MTGFSFGSFPFQTNEDASTDLGAQMLEKGWLRLCVSEGSVKILGVFVHMQTFPDSPRSWDPTMIFLSLIPQDLKIIFSNDLHIWTVRLKPPAQSSRISPAGIYSLQTMLGYIGNLASSCQGPRLWPRGKRLESLFLLLHLRSSLSQLVQ